MMKWGLLWAWTSLAVATPYEECSFVLPWARQAVHIAKKIELAEEHWRMRPITISQRSKGA
jgi:hypothetical protein